jgi:hypothetical protein
MMIELSSKVTTWETLTAFRSNRPLSPQVIYNCQDPCFIGFYFFIRVSTKISYRFHLFFYLRSQSSDSDARFSLIFNSDLSEEVYSCLSNYLFEPKAHL